MRRAFFYGRIFKGANMTEDNAHEFLKLKCERVIIVKYHGNFGSGCFNKPEITKGG